MLGTTKFDPGDSTVASLPDPKTIPTESPTGIQFLAETPVGRSVESAELAMYETVAIAAIAAPTIRFFMAALSDVVHERSFATGLQDRCWTKR